MIYWLRTLGRVYGSITKQYKHMKHDYILAVHKNSILSHLLANHQFYWPNKVVFLSSLPLVFRTDPHLYRSLYLWSVLHLYESTIQIFNDLIVYWYQLESSCRFHSIMLHLVKWPAPIHVLEWISFFLIFYHWLRTNITFIYARSYRPWYYISGAAKNFILSWVCFFVLKDQIY